MKKKIIIVLVIILVIILALAATVGVMAVNGKIALTSGQKMVKGLSDVKEEMSSAISDIEEIIEDYQKRAETPFSEETVITASLDQFEVAEWNAIGGIEVVTEELIDTVANTTVTNTVMADYKNNLVNESVSVQIGDIVEEISADFEYKNNTIALRSKELNEKYITATKSGIESSEEYEDLITIFEDIEELCEKQENLDLLLDEEEKNYLEENYGNILSNYITSDMLSEENITITVDGESKQCSEVSFTLDGTQIAELIDQYLTKLENDTTGKAIIMAKLQMYEEDFTTDDLSEYIDELRESLLDLDENLVIKFSVYCDYFNTYGFQVEVTNYEASKLKIVAILGESTQQLYVYGNENYELLNLTNTESNIDINFSYEEISGAAKIDKVNNQNEMTVNYDDGEIYLELNLTSIQTTKTDSAEATNNTINIYMEYDEDIIEVTLYVNDTLKYLGNLTGTTFNSMNSLSLDTIAFSSEYTSESLEDYITTVMENGNSIIEKAEESTLVKVLEYFYNQYLESYNNAIESVTETTSNQAVSTFNSIYTNYEGTQTSAPVKTLLQSIATNNATQINTSGHLISVTIIDSTGNYILENTTDATEIINSTSSINSSHQYQIAYGIDDDGYVCEITIYVAE